MKSLSMLVWVMQLGLSVGVPLGGYTLLAVWLRQRYDFGAWVLYVGLGLGLYTAIGGFRSSMKAMERMSREEKKDSAPPPPSFNDHL